MTISKYDGMVEVVVGAFIVNTKKQILLVKSRRWGGKYLFPGGHVEVGETFLAAAKREAKEETGLQIDPQYVVNFGESIFNPAYLERKAHFVYVQIVCQALTEEIKLEAQELKEYVWVSLDEALKLNLEDIPRQSIENYRHGVQCAISSRQWL